MGRIIMVVVLGAALFVGLFYAEGLTGIPLVQAAAARVSPHISVQTAFVAILFSVVTSVLLTLVMKPYQAFIARVWPSTEEDMLSHTRYVNEDALLRRILECFRFRKRRGR